MKIYRAPVLLRKDFYLFIKIFVPYNIHNQGILYKGRKLCEKKIKKYFAGIKKGCNFALAFGKQALRGHPEAP